MRKQIHITMIFLFGLMPYLGAAQEFKVSDQSKVTIAGTSTLHDWESVVEQVNGKGSLTVEEGELEEIQSLNVNFVVNSIKSGKGKMDDITYDALKEKKYPTITFKLTDITAFNGNTINAKGQLTIAGETNTIDVSGTAQVNGNTITISGEHPLKMTDYGIDPPTAMLGTIKVGDAVTIKYNLILTI